MSPPLHRGRQLNSWKKFNCRVALRQAGVGLIRKPFGLVFTVAGAAPGFPGRSVRGHSGSGAPDFPFNQ